MYDCVAFAVTPDADHLPVEHISYFSLLLSHFFLEKSSFVCVCVLMHTMTGNDPDVYNIYFTHCILTNLLHYTTGI